MISACEYTRMPRYFFHLLNDVAEVPDEEGRECETVADALVDARRSIGEIIAEEVAYGKNDVHITVTITDARGIAIATLAAVTVVKISKTRAPGAE